MMKVRLLKDWNWKKAGEVVDVFEPTGQNWLLNGIAELCSDSRSLEVERAVEPPEAVETAALSEKRRPAKRP